MEAPTRGAAVPGEAVFDSLGSVNWQNRQQRRGGSQNELVPVCKRREVRGTSRCTQAWVSFAGPLPGEKERLNRNCSTDSRSWFNRTVQPSLEGSECQTRHI